MTGRRSRRRLRLPNILRSFMQSGDCMTLWCHRQSRPMLASSCGQPTSRLKPMTARSGKSGEPYVVHPIEVGIILAGMQLDAETVAAGLLHDVVEDSGISL